MNSHQLISQQANLIEEELRKILGPGSHYALVDFPNHANVGDSAIWLGEMALLKKVTGVAPRYVCDYHNYSEKDLRRWHPEGHILIHGGGNFGDIWPAHHELRCSLISAFHDRVIVQLPQTISFGSPANVEKTARIIQEHGRFSLYVRDRVSERYAKDRFDCPVQLLPDSAFGIGPLAKPSQPIYDAFMLIREDAEKAGYELEPLKSITNSWRADWLVEPAHFLTMCRVQTALSNLGRRGGRMETGRLGLYGLLSSGRVQRGLRLLSTGRVVITDRLHAHILSLLMDIPHVVLDNNYGKIFNYIDAWTKEFEGLWTARTIEEAVQHHAVALQSRRAQPLS